MKNNKVTIIKKDETVKKMTALCNGWTVGEANTMLNQTKRNINECIVDVNSVIPSVGKE